MMAEPFHDMPYDGEHIMNRGAYSTIFKATANLRARVRVADASCVMADVAGLWMRVALCS